MDARSGRNDVRKQKSKDDRDRDRERERERDGRRHRSRSRSPARTARTLERRSRSPASEHRSIERRDGGARKGSESRKGQRADEESRKRRRSKSEEGEIDDVTPERERERIRSVATRPNAATRKPDEPTGSSGSVNAVATEAKSGMPKRTDYLEGYSRWLDSETESESEAEQSEAQPTGSNGPEQPGSGTEQDVETAEPNEPTADENGPEPEMDTAKDEIATGRLDTIEPEVETTTARERAYYPALSGCRSVNEYDLLNRIEEGTYGVVYRARDKKRNETVALKRLKMEKEKEGFPITSLREINTLLKAQHENIVTVREIVVGSNMDRIYVVMDYADHDLRNLMESMRTDQRFTLGEVKSLLSQLLAAVAHLHDNWILHRDLKTSNLLLTNRGVLKVGDFGLAREYGSPLKPFTPVVVTLWYRAPELLLGAARYSTAIDVWSVGCIFAELLLFRPLWSAKSENEQLGLIFRDLGTPSERIWPDCNSLPLWNKLQFAHYPYNQLRNRFSRNLLTDSGWSLLNRLFTYDPVRRITAADARRHEYLSESPLPTEPGMFRTWPSRNEAPPPAAHAAPRPQPLAAAQVLTIAARRAVDEVLARKKRETPPPPIAGVGAQAQLLGKDDDI